MDIRKAIYDREIKRIIRRGEGSLQIDTSEKMEEMLGEIYDVLANNELDEYGRIDEIYGVFEDNGIMDAAVEKRHIRKMIKYYAGKCPRDEKERERMKNILRFYRWAQ